jgi:hypothetical protein
MLSIRMLSIRHHFTALFASLDNSSYQGTQMKNHLKARWFTIYWRYVDRGTSVPCRKKIAEVHVSRDLFPGRVEMVCPTQVAHVLIKGINDYWRTYRQTVRPSARLAAGEKPNAAMSGAFSGRDGQVHPVSARQSMCGAREDIIGIEKTAAHYFS